MKHHTLAMTLTIILLLVLALGGCRANETSDASLDFYLVTNNATWEAIKDIDLADLAVDDEPILTVADIIGYQEKTHEITLTEDAAERLRQLRVPVSGRFFVVYAQGEPIYVGAFWTPLSSLIYEGITAMVPLIPERNSLTLQVGYPSAISNDLNAQLDDARIMDVLKQTKKLK